MIDIVLKGGPEDGLELRCSDTTSEVAALTELNEIAHYRRLRGEFYFSHVRKGTEHVG